MRSHVLLGCLLVFLNIVAVKPDVSIVNVNNNALIAVLTGEINLENLADLKIRISNLEEHLSNDIIGTPRKESFINPTVSPLPPIELHKEKNRSNCTHQLEQCLKPYPPALKAFITESLINTLEGSNNITDVSSLIAELSYVEPKIYSEVIRRALHRCNNSVDLVQLLAIIVRNTNTAQVVSNLSLLLRKVKSAENLNDTILLNLASEVRQLRDQTDFKNLDLTMKNTFYNMVDNLPGCVRNLFFLSRVCIWNVKAEQLLYGNQLDLQFIVHKINNAFIFESSIAPNNYLYASEDFINFNDTWHIVKLGQRPTTLYAKLWYIELAGDSCYLKNVHNKEYLFMAENKVNTRPRKDTDLMWNVSSCFSIGS